MILGNIQSFKIVIIQFDFRTLYNGKTEGGKDGTYLPADLNDRMNPAAFYCVAGQGNIYLFL